MKEKIEDKDFNEPCIRDLVANQKGELSVASRYYTGNIAEGNWSQIEDASIEDLDKRIIDVAGIIFSGVELRTNNSEYEYIFMPSFYAVETLILYYLQNSRQAKRIYGLKNAVVMRNGKNFCGGLPFILRYLKDFIKDERVCTEFICLTEELSEAQQKLKVKNETDDFINDIIDCIRGSRSNDMIKGRS